MDEAWLSTDTAKKRLGHCVVEPANGDWDREWQNIEAAIEESGGRVYGANGAAARLHIPPSTLDCKIKKLQIRKRHLNPARDVCPRWKHDFHEYHESISAFLRRLFRHLRMADNMQ
jgi:hypothetical protein